MKITKIECFVLLVPDYRADANSSAQDNLVVKIHTDEGHIRIGETDTNAWVARAMIEARGTHIMGLGLTEMLIGADPTDVEGLWDRMYKGSAMTGRRGLGICALRRDLCSEELPMVDGYIPLPTKPGLGVTIDENALNTFRV